ncbi:MAG: WYL domain-containing protein [Acidimicrobiia bacterium]
MQRVVERVLNLLAYLLTAGRPVTADEIRNTVAGYSHDSDAAFRRTFERDKDLLRSLGVPLTMSATDIWEVEHGYVIPPEEYAIEDPGLTDEERSALLAAVQAVQFTGRSTGLTAIFKLGGASPILNPPSLAADLGHDLDLLGVLFEAISTRTKLSFEYAGKRRTVLPYALGHRFGHWYLTAPEIGAPEIVKAFRVDRMGPPAIEGASKSFDRPAAFNPDEVLPSGAAEGRSDRSATVVFDADVGRVAVGQVPGAEVTATDGLRTTAEVPVRDDAGFINWLLGFDDKAVIVAPEDLRDRLLAHIGAVP